MALSSPGSEPDADAELPVQPRRVARARRSHTRRTALSVGVIVEAAIEVLDETGVAGLTMRNVAAQLGTGAASLYAYVSGKEELLELVYDELVGRVPLPAEPDPARWREQAKGMLTGMRDVLAAHRDAALAGLGRVPTSPQTLAAAESLCAVLRAGGLSDYAVALGLDLLILYVSACAFEDGLLHAGGASDEDVVRYFEDVHRFYAQLPASRYPVLAAIAPDMFDHDDVERFEFGLDVLLDGLAGIGRGH